ncbi:MAG: ROK family protein [Armatimonadetes bacterium]|nr:ROK family protein [Armatimonadota bacterium]
MSNSLALGLDVGGTCIKGVIIDTSGRNLGSATLPCVDDWKYSESGLKSLPDLIGAGINEVLFSAKVNKDDLKGIGIGLANPITPGGLLQNVAPHPRNWSSYDLAKELQGRWNIPLRFAIDSHAAAVGEAYYGAGSHNGTFTCVTLGTGVGSGTIVDGKIFRGGLDVAGSLGHIIVVPNDGKLCVCGGLGCLETVCSASALAENYAELVGVRSEHMELETICARAVAGDQAAVKTLEEAGYYLGVALVNLVTLLSPELIVVGGGIAQAGDFLLDQARRVITVRAFPPVHRNIPVVRAALGSLSGAYGAACLILKDST